MHFIKHQFLLFCRLEFPNVKDEKKSFHVTNKSESEIGLIANSMICIFF